MGDFPEWYPSLSEIAALVPTHTVDVYPDPNNPSSEANGVPGPIFSEETTPTLDQVKTFIGGAGALVSMRFPDLTSPERAKLAGHAIALRVAAFVELAAPTSSDNRYAQLMAAFEDTLDVLAGTPVGSGGSGGSALSYVPSPYLPVFNFPPAVPWGDHFI